jgi:hypothetical protein
MFVDKQEMACPIDEERVHEIKKGMYWSNQLSIILLTNRFKFKRHSVGGLARFRELWRGQIFLIHRRGSRRRTLLLDGIVMAFLMTFFHF